MSPAKNLDRFKGRKNVLMHSLHLAYAAGDFPCTCILAYARLTRRFRLRESLSPPSDNPLRHCLKGREALWPQDLPQGAHALETSTESTK